jgi:hypothetical protein
MLESTPSEITTPLKADAREELFLQSEEEDPSFSMDRGQETLLDKNASAVVTQQNEEESPESSQVETNAVVTQQDEKSPESSGVGMNFTVLRKSSGKRPGVTFRTSSMELTETSSDSKAQGSSEVMDEETETPMQPHPPTSECKASYTSNRRFTKRRKSSFSGRRSSRPVMHHNLYFSTTQ